MNAIKIPIELSIKDKTPVHLPIRTGLGAVLVSVCSNRSRYS